MVVGELCGESTGNIQIHPQSQIKHSGTGN